MSRDILNDFITYEKGFVLPIHGWYEDFLNCQNDSQDVLYVSIDCYCIQLLEKLIVFIVEVVHDCLEMFVI